MRKLERGQKITRAILAVIFASVAGLLAFTIYGQRTVSPAQLKAELATLPEPLRGRTIAYLQSSHETLLNSYYPGDRITSDSQGCGA